jgi:hypothetical protein
MDSLKKMCFAVSLCLQIIGSVEYKSYNNWRHIYRSPEVHLCKVLEFTTVPLFTGYIDAVLLYWPELPRKCPIEPMKKYFRNFTLEVDKKGNINLPNFGWRGIPNGEYRVRFRAFSPDDPVGGHVTWIYEHKKALNFGEF